MINSAVQNTIEVQASKKVTSSVAVREACFNDYQEISSLESRYGLETKTYEAWNHLWTSNPLYRTRKKDWPIGWVLENADKQVVGYLGNIPLAYELDGQQLVAAGTHAWVVDSSYRSYSILLLDRYFRQKNVDLFISTTVNSQAFKVFALFNSPPIPLGAWDQSAFWVTEYRAFAFSLLSMKQVPFARTLSYPLSVAVLLKASLTRPTWKLHRTRITGVDVQQCTGFDNRFDVFWEALRKRNPHQLWAVRSREFLEWHFKYALLENRLWILAVTDRAGCLVAYSIFCRQDNPRFGLKRVRLVDYQSLDGKTSVLPMMVSALKKCHEEKIHMLENIGYCAEQGDAIGCLAPLRRRLPCWMYYYKAANPLLAERLSKPHVWSASRFDGDSSL